MAQEPKASLWQHADFMRLWVGETISQMGSSVTQLALPLVAIQVLRASTFEVGLLNAVDMLPFLLVGLPAGVWVDRLRKRRVLIAGDLGRALLLASIPLAYAFDALTISQLYAVGFLVGVLTVFFDVAYQSYLPSLVERGSLVEGNSKLEVSRSAAQITGPGIAGALIGLVGAAAAIVVDSVSFVASAVAIGLIRKGEAEPVADGEARPRMRAQMREGLDYVWHHPYLRNIAFCTGTSNLFSSMFYAVYIVYVVRTLGYGAGRLGFIFMVGNVGFLVGALVAARCAARFGLGPTITHSVAWPAIGFFLVPLAPPDIALPFLLASQLIFGIGVPIYNINQVSLRQSMCPARLQGRMNATMRFMVWGTMPLGSLLGGTLGTVLGLRNTMWVAAVGGALAFLWVRFSPVHALVDMPDPSFDPQPEVADRAGSSGLAAALIAADPTGGAGADQVNPPVN